MKHRAPKSHRTSQWSERKGRLPDMRPDEIAGPIAKKFPDSWRRKKGKHHGK